MRNNDSNKNNVKGNRLFYRFIKRCFDIFCSLFAILLFSPIFIIISLIVKCSDGGSIFYKHKRLGKDGKPILLPKFRSMKPDADKLESSLTPEQLKEYNKEFKLDNDPRITKVGKFLRVSSLDELPNLFSVLKGDISFVGPRPIMEDEANFRYGEDRQKLLSIKPGMVGWWACHGRNEISYDSGERQKMELYYVDNCNIFLDIKILVLTLISVVKGKGAK